MQGVLGLPVRLAVRVGGVLLVLTLAACSGGSSNDLSALDKTYKAEVRRTAHGIPHIKSDNWTGLGLGYGYAYAQNNVCLLGREVVRVNGQLSRWFGPEDGNIESDFVHSYYERPQFIDPLFSTLRPELRQLIEGFVLGYNRYLRETGIGGLPAECRGGGWMREISVQDMYRRFYSLVLRAGVTAPELQGFIADAKPPESKSIAVDVELDPRLVSLGAGLDFGSNAYGLGREVTESGKGLLLGNPHFSWITTERFYEVHLTIPGKIDVMGASLSAVPLVNIGFTHNYAWSHTVSTADRFTLYELELVPGDPTSYLFEGKPQAMLAEDFTVQVLQPGGSLANETRTLYTTRYGPMISVGWSAASGFAVRDANVQNGRFLEQIYRMNTAADLDEFMASQREIIGIPWANTIAVDSGGRGYYADVTVVPNVDAAKQAACPPTTPFGGLLIATGLPVLDGRRSECDWKDDPAAPQPGIFPSSELPWLVRNDYVANSNNSYWYTNPEQPLTGFAPIIGSEDSELTGRQRLGLWQVRDRLAGSDGFAGNRFNMENLQQIMFANRSGRGELAVDGVVTICGMESNQVDLDGEIIDVSEACGVLANWDRTTNADSVGDHVFREFWETAWLIENLYLIPFDPADPIDTPNTINVADATVRAEVMLSLARSVKTLQEAAIPLTASLGSVQFEPSAVGPIAIQGGLNLTGSYNAITSAGLEAGVGYTPIVHGTSYIQTVTFDDRGPVAEALLTYGQSVDLDSPLSYDQTLLYRDKQWVKLPFHDADIDADPLLERFEVEEVVPFFP